MTTTVKHLSASHGTAQDACVSALFVGLPKDDGFIARVGAVDQDVSVPAPRAQEEAPLFVDLGRHGFEHDSERTPPACPHGRLLLQAAIVADHIQAPAGLVGRAQPR